MTVPDDLPRQYLPFPDAAILDPETTDAELYVLAWHLSDRGGAAYNPDIVAGGPINRTQLAAARKRLARRRIAFVDRPKNGSRAPVKLLRVRADFDHRHEGAGGKRTPHVLVHASAVAELKGGRKHGALTLRLLLLYARAQRITKAAAQIGDDEAAYLLGRPVELIRLARKRLLKLGLAVEHSPKGTRKYQAAVMIVPAWIVVEADRPRPENLEQDNTLYLRDLELDGETVRIYASRKVADAIGFRADTAGREATRLALEPLAGREPIDGMALLDALRERVPPLSGDGRPPSQGTETTKLRTSEPPTDDRSSLVPRFDLSSDSALPNTTSPRSKGQDLRGRGNRGDDRGEEPIASSSRPCVCRTYELTEELTTILRDHPGEEQIILANFNGDTLLDATFNGTSDAFAELKALLGEDNVTRAQPPDADRLPRDERTTSPGEQPPSSEWFAGIPE